jgi:hypothetical protein
MQMGLGLLGDPNIVFKRKFRWTFQVEGVCGIGDIPSSFVKVAARPNLEIEETQIDYLNGRTWIPGKGSWNEMTVTYYDVSLATGTSGVAGGDPALLFTWLRSVYDYGDPIHLNNGSRRSAYAATGILTLYGGCGEPLEMWVLGDMWPKSIDFGELDMSNTEPCEISLTLRYSNVQYTNLCGRQAPPPCCKPCN